MNTYVTKNELVQLLGITNRSYFWQAPAVQAARFGTSANYDCAVIDEVFRTCRHNFAEPLTAAKLLAGKVVLVTPPAAKQQLKVTHMQTMKDCYAGRLNYIFLPGVRGTRLSQSSITAVASARERRAARLVSDCELAARILGIEVTGVRTLLARGILEAIEGTYPTEIKWDSLIRCLFDRLPSWITPAEWIEEQLATDKPLLSSTNVAKQLGGKQYLHEAMEQRLLRYIRIGGPASAFTQDSVAKFIASDEPVNDSMLAAIYDEPQTTIEHLRAEGKLACTTHEHDDPQQLVKSCIVARLCETVAYAPKKWMEQQIAKRAPLRTSAQAASYLGISLAELDDIVQAKRISHVRLPTGDVKFAPAPLKQFKVRHLAKR